VPAPAPTSAAPAPGASHKVAGNDAVAPAEQEHLWVLERTV